ncbi:MAG: DUF2147 domain-containing protein [Ramlibacter sp.]
MKYLHTLAAAASLLAALPATAQTAGTPQGSWITESGNLEVLVAPCGAALCGTVAKVLANKSMSRPGTELPPESRPSPGLIILSGFEPSGEGEWKGQLFNRENGKTYSALITLPAPDQMAVRGYVGLPAFGQTQLWRRVQP